jgi:hypothetical protein
MAGMLCVLFLASCAGKPKPTDDASAIQNSLAFVEDGKTTKEELRRRVGPPSDEFERGRIWTYSRLDVSYHLVVVFDDQNVATTHRIVKVR